MTKRTSQEDVDKTWKLYDLILDHSKINLNNAPQWFLKSSCPQCLEVNLVENEEAGDTVCASCGYVKNEKRVNMPKKARAGDRKELYDNYIVKDMGYKRQSHYK